MNEINKLKEENARLKREYDILDGIIDLNNAKIGQLQKENERLKEKIIKLSEEKGSLIVKNNTLKEENFNFEEIVKLCRCEQYEQTLQEIKTIVMGDYDTLDPQALQEIRQKILEWEE